MQNQIADNIKAARTYDSLSSPIWSNTTDITSNANTVPASILSMYTWKKYNKLIN